MTANTIGHAGRPTTQRMVLVNRLSGGPLFKGSLVRLGRTGARVILDRPLESGEVVRLTFPQKPEEVRYPSQTIIGLVRHSQNTSGRHVIGVTFGWCTGSDRKGASSRLGAALWSWFRDLCKRKKS